MCKTYVCMLMLAGAMHKHAVLLLQSNLDELCRAKFGRRVLLQLLHPNYQKYVPLHHQQMAHPPAKPASGAEILEGGVSNTADHAIALSLKSYIMHTSCTVCS